MPLRFAPTRNAGSLAVLTTVVFTTDEASFDASSAAFDAVLGSTPNLFAVRGEDGWEQRAIVGSDLPNPSTTTLGGVFSYPVESNSVLSGIGSDGTPTRASTTGTGNVVRATSPTITSPTVATSIGVSGPVTVTSNSSAALAVGPNGVTNPALQVDASLASSATGLSIISQSAASAVVNISAISSGSNASLTFDAKGSGTIDFNITGTGNIEFWRDVNIMPSRGINYFGSGSGFTYLKAAATASGTVTLPAATDTLVGKATVDTLTNKTYNTQGTGNVFTLNGAAFGTQPQAIIALNQLFTFVTVTGINFGSGNTDTAFVFPSPPTGYTRYSLRAAVISSPSATLASATCGIFTATAAGGVALVASGTAVTITTAADSTANNFQALTPVNVNTMTNLFSALGTANTIYFRVQTAAGAANTASVTMQIEWLP